MMKIFTLDLITTIIMKFPPETWIMQKILSLSLLMTIKSFKNVFCCVAYCYFYYNNGFPGLAYVFSTSHIARQFMKLIAWTTSFMKEHPDFVVTWLIWNVIFGTLFLPWTKENSPVLCLILICNVQCTSIIPN